MASEAQKLASKRWRDNNPEKYKETTRRSSIKYYYKNREKILIGKKEYYEQKNIIKENIIEEKEI